MFQTKLDYLPVFLIISATYMIAFSASIYLINPVQQQYFPHLTSYASLIFLPHGVRVLSAWLWGWRSIPLIAPVSLFAHWLNFGPSGFTDLGVVAAMSGVICAAFSFWAFSKCGMDFRVSDKKTNHWGDVLITGCFASILNTVGMGVIFGHEVPTLLGYLIGDISGMFGCMFFLMLAFMAWRNVRCRFLRLVQNLL